MKSLVSKIRNRFRQTILRRHGLEGIRVQIQRSDGTWEDVTSRVEKLDITYGVQQQRRNQ